MPRFLTVRRTEDETDWCDNNDRFKISDACLISYLLLQCFVFFAHGQVAFHLLTSQTHTHSCWAVFSTTLRATRPSHLLLLHAATAPLKLQHYTCYSMPLSHTQRAPKIFM